MTTGRFSVYIIMEYAENGSLLDIIKKDGQIDEKRSKKWFSEIVAAVQYCHENGVVHRLVHTASPLVTTSGDRFPFQQNKNSLTLTRSYNFSLHPCIRHYFCEDTNKNPICLFYVSGKKRYQCQD